MFALPISMPRFERIIFYQNSPKIKVFCKKCEIFVRWGLRPQTLVPLAAGGSALNPPANSPPHCEFLATRLLHTVYTHQHTRSHG